MLSYFFLNPEEQLYVNEIAKTLKLDKRNLVKKLKEFEADGLLAKTARGNMKLYSANRRNPLYNEYRKIILATAGVEGALRRILAALPGVTEAYLYGSYARNAMDAASDIDLLVVGEHKALVLQRSLSELQRTIGREINCVSMGAGEFQAKKKDPFISGVLKGEKIKVFP